MGECQCATLYRINGQPSERPRNKMDRVIEQRRTQQLHPKPKMAQPARKRARSLLSNQTERPQTSLHLHDKTKSDIPAVNSVAPTQHPPSHRSQQLELRRPPSYLSHAKRVHKRNTNPASTANVKRHHLGKHGTQRPKIDSIPKQNSEMQNRPDHNKAVKCEIPQKHIHWTSGGR